MKDFASKCQEHKKGTRLKNTGKFGYYGNPVVLFRKTASGPVCAAWPKIVVEQEADNLV